MEYTKLGRTALRVSRLGLGCGGPSRLGLKTGGTEESAERVVREALALGVNFIDTAEAYGTETVVGRAVAGSARDQLVISTKVGVGLDGRRATADETRQRVLACLRRLNMHYVDILHLHGVSRDEYAYARDELLPVLQAMKREGSIRFIGITEAFGPDPAHAMLVEAMRDDCWDAVMVGFSLLNQSARERVLAITQRKEIGTLCMFAVRRALSQPAALKPLIQDLVDRGLVDAQWFNGGAPLGFLTSEGVAATITEAAYRFCRWEPGIDVVLSGTSSVEHLRENAAALAGPPLPVEVVDRLKRIFAGVDCVSGN